MKYRFDVVVFGCGLCLLLCGVFSGIVNFYWCAFGVVFGDLFEQWWKS